MKKILTVLLLLLPLTKATLASVPMTSDTAACHLQRLEAVRLPDLHTPRAGHQTLLVGDAVMVAGGHTTSFVPTATAELLHPGDTVWTQLSLAYTHDFGASALLRSGEVLLMGGAAEPLGIGQTFNVERYDPATARFTGFGCLDTKRMYASAEQLADGRVAVSGNWYHQDDTELFDGVKFFTHQHAVSAERANPYIFPTSDGDAIILGGIDAKGNNRDDYTTVDCLRGQPFDVPLLRHWQPIRLLYPHPAQASLIGDTAQGDYSYLLVLENRACDMRIALVRDTAISLLTAIPPLPRTGPEGQPIAYVSTVLVDREAQRGYVVGCDALLFTPADVPVAGRDSVARHYVFSFSYAEAIMAPSTKVSQPSTLNPQLSTKVSQRSTLNAQRSTLYYTDPLPGIGNTTPVLTPNGDMVLVGGVATDNFAPFAAAYRLPLGRPLADGAEAMPTTETATPWRWWLRGLGLLVVAWLVVAWLRRKPTGKVKTDEAPDDEEEEGPNTDMADESDDAAPSAEDAAMLMQRIDQLMASEKPYLNPNLKVADVAKTLHEKSRRVSDTIKAQSGLTFPQYVSKLRVEHASQMLHDHPEMKTSTVGAESGFATDQSFFRAFKLLTGKTPTEWRAE